MVSEIAECFRCGHGKERHLLKEFEDSASQNVDVRVAGTHIGGQLYSNISYNI
jgi:Zn ribbon nucleic-acid-binding protein